ncbi:hypothetical protein [Enterococcus mundtii]|uniref:hypothetical protein n=1 Tax=Enterococcus mundtii TaxID=53346 RepID=UPI000E05496D|nr:hypothetical protein [Enterococcus mundtii]STE38114.1 Uncharacterised protein [Enterococcus mundtii]
MPMRKIKETILWQVINLKQQLKSKEEFLLIGMKLGIAIFMIISGITLMMKSETHHYSEISQTPEEFLSILADEKSDEQRTLIIYHTDCPTCKKLENRIMKEVVETRKTYGRDFVALDIKEMTTEQLLSVKENFPDLLVEGNKISTPTVANIGQMGNGSIRVFEKSTNGNIKDIEEVLSQATE